MELFSQEQNFIGFVTQNSWILFTYKNLYIYVSGMGAKYICKDWSKVQVLQKNISTVKVKVQVLLVKYNDLCTSTGALIVFKCKNKYKCL